MKTVQKAGIAIAALTFAACASVTAMAGDLHGYRGSVKDGPMPQYQAAGPCYVRGDVGYSGSSDPDIRWPVTSYPGGVGPAVYLGDNVSGASLDDTWFGEIGIGCGSGSRGFRADFTLGYHGDRKITGEPQPYTPQNGNTPYDDPLHSSLSTYTAMLNIYKDLGRWGNFVPYLGAGVGVAYHQMDEVYFTENPNLVNRIAGNNDVAFAWSLMAGFGYQISNRAILDVGYRYLNMGKIESGRVDSAGFVNPAVKVDDIAAHEFKVGLRYHFGTSGDCCSYK